MTAPICPVCAPGPRLMDPILAHDAPPPGATHHPMPSPPPSYRVATAPDGRKLWWLAWETIPPDHTAVRLATPEEAQVMRRIEAHPNPPVSLGRRIGELMEKTI